MEEWDRTWAVQGVSPAANPIICVREYPALTRLTSLALIAATGLALVQGCGRSPVIAPESSDPAETQTLVRTQTLPGTGLKMTAPEGWGFVPDPEFVQAECRPEGATGDLPVILAQSDTIKTDLSLPSIVSGFTRQIPKGIENPEITRDESLRTHLADTEAYQVGFKGKLENESVQGLQVMLKKGRRLVVLTLLAKQQGYQANSKLFEQLLQKTSW